MVFFRLRVRTAFFAVALYVSALFGADSQFDPPALYLTWQRDPSSTMTIHWHTLEEAKTQVFYRRSGNADWQNASGTSQPLPSSIRTVHTVELTDLDSGADHEFCFWPGEKAFKFRTAPKELSRPFRFVTGGDVYHERRWMDAMNALAGRLDPMFVLLGGDLAYSCEGKIKPEKMERWDAYFDSWKQHARTPDGRLVPMVVTIGNHEVHGSWHQPLEHAAVFFTLFSMPGEKGYGVLDFGRYLSVFLLNSAHTHPVEGAQTEWLDQALAKRRHTANLIPVYHVPAYPSYRPDDEGENGDITQSLRRFWCPLFDKYGVGVAFENHDHTFKRSRPIRGNKVDPKGVIYLGDGAWGVNVRKPDPNKPRWYIERTIPVRHLFVVTLHKGARHVQAVNEAGEFFDELYQKTR